MFRIFLLSLFHNRCSLKALKECADEIDLGTQYHMTRYAFLFESIVLSDGSTLVPPPDEGSSINFLPLPASLIDFNSFTGLGLKATIETIDNRGDFKTYMQNYAYARGNAPPRGPRREGPSDEGFVRLNVIRSVGSLTTLTVTSIAFL